MSFKALSVFGLGAVLVFCSFLLASDKSQSSSDTRETVAKPMSEKERRKKEERLRKELQTPWKKWLNEDVSYIITDEERKAFKDLQTDEERQSFVEQFWLRRDPTPDTEENEFKEEHYRRIAYANDHYASGIPGWKTDRGRIYIMYGPPDEIESHPSGGTYERPIDEGGGETSTYPFEDWRYRYIEGIGNNVIIEFVDPTMSGEYHMTMDPSEKDALLYVPNAGLTLYEQMGMSNKTARFNRTDGTHLGVSQDMLTESMNEFTRLETFAKLNRPPQVKFRDLEEVISTNIRYNSLPMKVRADYIRVTDSTVLVPITIYFEKHDLQYKTKDNFARATVNIFGRVTSMSRRVITTFEEPIMVETAAELLNKTMTGAAIYQKILPLTPGMYRLNIVAKDVVGGTMTNYEVALHVPHFDEEQLGSSTLILADDIEKVPTRSIGTGQFVIGDSKVRPRMTDTFSRNEKLGIYQQFYNFGADENARKPNGSIEYSVTKNGTNEKVFDYTEDVATLPGASPQQVTVEKILSLDKLTPGQYTIRLKVTDKNRNQVLTPVATFTVT
ncbi:MAG TPA: GWxTD domain-containing protein [Bryobacteraceae bacterium]|nr:GWxTD domain-containing protein [Bryobacteraceae bacterium]